MSTNLEAVFLDLAIATENFQSMITIHNPKFVSYERYSQELLYLRWQTVRPSRNITTQFNEDYDANYAHEVAMVHWLCTNCTGSFSSKNLLLVSFENRKDAFLFKLAFG